MVELTYGLERLTMFLQNVDNVYDINWNGKDGAEKITYGDVNLRSEVEFSGYCFEGASVDILKQHFLDAEHECNSLLKLGLILPAYEQCMKASHAFNLLDSRGALSVVQRADRIARLRALVKMCCEKYIEQQEA